MRIAAPSAPAAGGRPEGVRSVSCCSGSPSCRLADSAWSPGFGSPAWLCGGPSMPGSPDLWPSASLPLPGSVFFAFFFSSARFRADADRRLESRHRPVQGRPALAYGGMDVHASHPSPCGPLGGPVGGPVDGPVGGPVAGHPGFAGERGRRGAVRVGVRSGGRPAGRPGGRPAGHPAMPPQSGFAASRRRSPRSGRADIPASPKGRATCRACRAGSPASIALGATAIPSAPVRQRPSASAAPIALGASTIASAPATQRLRPQTAAAPAPRTARLARGTSLPPRRIVQVDATKRTDSTVRGAGSGGAPAARCRLRRRFARGFVLRFARGFTPRPRPCAAIPHRRRGSRRPGFADIPPSRLGRNSLSSLAPPALGAVAIASAPAPRRLLATAAPDRGRRPMGGPLRPLDALSYMKGRSGSVTDGGAGAPPASASSASGHPIVAPASRPASPGRAGAPADRVPSPAARVPGSRSAAIWRLWMPSQEQPTAKPRRRT